MRFSGMNNPFEGQINTDAVAEEAGAEASESSEDGSAEEAEASPEDKLLKQLLAAKFNRTPQAILEAWSYQEPQDDDDKDSRPEVAKGKVGNFFRSLLVVDFESKITLEADQQVTVEAKGELAGTLKIISVDGRSITGKFVDDKNPEDEQKPANAADVADGEKAEEGMKAGEAQTEEPENPSKSETKPRVQLTAGDVVLISVIDPNAESAADRELRLKVKRLTSDVALARWDEVKAFFAAMKKQEDAAKAYAHLLDALANPIPVVGDEVTFEAAREQANEMRNNGQQIPNSFLTPGDILAISEASPTAIKIISNVKTPLTDKKGDEDKAAEKDDNPNDTEGESTGEESEAQPDLVGSLAVMLRTARNAGHDTRQLLKQIQEGTTHFGGDDADARIAAATLLMGAGLPEEAQTYLPPLDDESTASNIDALLLWEQLASTRFEEERAVKWLNVSWDASGKIATLENAKDEFKDAALERLVELSTEVEEEVGDQWMNESFTQSPQRGMQVLTHLGTRSSAMALTPSNHRGESRLRVLQLQNRSVEKLIDLSPELAGEWNATLTLLADNWVSESELSIRYSSGSNQGGMRIDRYGNYYWPADDDDSEDMSWRYDGGDADPIAVAEMLEIAPSKDWQQHVTASLQIRIDKAFAQLHMRDNGEDEAFPFIESIARRDKEVAEQLVSEFLDLWITNHDPNKSKRDVNPYIYYYGFDEKADAIPLTRSKQERNLEDLTRWVKRIRALDLKDVDETQLASAFTTCHSNAEVFSMERVRQVFGDLKTLKPDTVAAMGEEMRANLVSTWRQVKTQEKNQTKRKEPEVQQEVIRGYGVATEMVTESLKAAPDNWKLNLTLAKLMHDENSYSQSIQKSSEFSHRRDAAFEQFRIATEKYAAAVGELELDEKSTEVYDNWFYAALGACDLGKVDEKMVAKTAQYEKIRVAIESLPGVEAKDHLAKFANNLFTRMSPIKPELKFRYLKGGFEIVGDHPRSYEARMLYDYYRDLVSEIKLEISIDGPDTVAAGQPFGAFVNLVHTGEIERESGGFGKYVQNQNSMMYSWNYGRPTADYRDKFNDSVSQALDEQFEIISVTFESPDNMMSRPSDQEGWRVTPYAYLLLKPKGPEVDRMAPVKIDMDFLDTSGYAVIPVESATLMIDAVAEGKGSVRPYSNLKMTQTLDERQADDGRLILEVTASANGLVPALEEVVNLERSGFELVSVDDQGILPSRFDYTRDEIVVLSDRSWSVEYRAREGSKPTSFEFPDSRLTDASMTFQRYDDADLVESEPTVKLTRQYRRANYAFLFWLLPLFACGVVAAVLAGRFFADDDVADQPRFQVPQDINPFTVLSLLKTIENENGISESQSTELNQSINRIEQFYFGNAGQGGGNQVLPSGVGSPEDLSEVARKWVGRSTSNASG